MSNIGWVTVGAGWGGPWTRTEGDSPRHIITQGPRLTKAPSHAPHGSRCSSPTVGQITSHTALAWTSHVVPPKHEASEERRGFCYRGSSGCRKKGAISDLYYVNKQGKPSAYCTLSSVLKRDKGTKGKEQRPFGRTQEKPVVPRY